MRLQTNLSCYFSVVFPSILLNCVCHFTSSNFFFVAFFLSFLFFCAPCIVQRLVPWGQLQWGVALKFKTMAKRLQCRQFNDILPPFSAKEHNKPNIKWRKWLSAQPLRCSPMTFPPKFPINNFSYLSCDFTMGLRWLLLLLLVLVLVRFVVCHNFDY